MKRLIRFICILLGFLAMGLGIIGILIPILPTTPFFLSAALLFARGSERFHQWFLHTSLYQKYIEQAFYKKEMKKKEKLRFMICLGLIFLVAFLFSPVWPMRILILVIAAAHLYFFTFRVKTLKA